MVNSVDIRTVTRSIAHSVKLSIFVLLASIGVAWAQTPTVTLSASRVSPDTQVTLRATGLSPESDVQLELRRPDGATDLRELTSTASGALTTTFTPTTEGMWIVRLRGNGVHSIFGLAVTDREAAEPAADTTTNTATATEPSLAEPTAPGATDPIPEGQVPTAETAPEPPDDFRIDGADVVALLDGEEVWRLTFTADSGPTGPLLSGDAALWVPHGLSLLAVDLATGVVLERSPVPAPVTSLEHDGPELVVTSRFEDGVTTELRMVAGVPDDVVRFGTQTEAFGWLQREAAVADPAARLDVDPTNPWLYLFAGRAQQDVERYEQAIEQGQTFFDLAGIGAALYAEGEEALANRALDAAFRDWADRGYDPDLLTESALRQAYDFPLLHLQEALAAGDRAAAGFWAPWAYRMAGGSVGASRQALRDYAALLRAAGDREGASLWSARAGELLRTRVGAVMDRAFLGLAGVGWWAVLALIVASLLLYATLTAKVWRPQTLHLRHRAESGRQPKSWARSLGLRFFSFTEKLVLVLLFIATLAMAGLATWNTQGELPTVAGSGTLASAPARAFVDGLDGDPVRVAFVEGYSAQVAGDTQAARAAYQAAGDFAPAINNLAALEGEERLYQRALETAPGLPAARYNLGRITSPSPFHDAYRPGQPLLVAPSTADLKIAVAGSWRTAIAEAFVAPWGDLRTTTPGVPVWLWTIVVALYFLIGLALLVALVIPRPRVARNAPRTLLYHVLAVAIPGTGLADELWGVLLLAPWSILGLDALLQWTGAGSPLGLDLTTTLWALAAIYALNLLAFVVEFLSYRRRMKELKKANPELARRFGLRA